MRIIWFPLGILGAWIVWSILQGPTGIMSALITGTTVSDEILVRGTPIFASAACFAFGVKFALFGGSKKEK